MARYFGAPHRVWRTCGSLQSEAYRRAMMTWMRANGIDPGTVLQSGVLLRGGVLHYTEVQRGRPDATGYRPLRLSRDGSFQRRRRVRIRIGFAEAQARAS